MSRREEVIGEGIGIVRYYFVYFADPLIAAPCPWPRPLSLF